MHLDLVDPDRHLANLTHTKFWTNLDFTHMDRMDIFDLSEVKTLKFFVPRRIFGLTLGKISCVRIVWKKGQHGRRDHYML